MFDKMKAEIKAVVEDVTGVSQEERAGVFEGLTFSPKMLQGLREAEEIPDSVGDGQFVNMLEHHFGMDIRLIPSITELAKK